MKNVQIIDGAENCTYSVYRLTDDEFAAVFPTPGQDIEFIEDVVSRLGDDQVKTILGPVWARGEVSKALVNGIHGTLFYGLLSKKRFYPSKKNSEMLGVFQAKT